MTLLKSSNLFGGRTRLAQLARLQSQVVQLQQELDDERRKPRADSLDDMGDIDQLDGPVGEGSRPIPELTQDAPFVAHSVIPLPQPSITLGGDSQAEQSATIAANSSASTRQDGSYFYGGAGSAYLLVSLISAHEHLRLDLQRSGLDTFGILTLRQACRRIITLKMSTACTMAWILAPTTVTGI